MGLHLRREELTGWIEKTLDPESVVRVDAHLAECDQCRHELYGFSCPTEPEISRQCGVPVHLSYESFRALLEPQQSNSVNVHLAFCTECQRQLNDLGDFEKRSEPDGVSAQSKPATGWLQRVVGLLCAPSLRLVPAAAMALGVVVLVSGILQRLYNPSHVGDTHGSTDTLLALHSGYAFANRATPLYTGVAILCVGVVFALIRATAAAQRQHKISKTHITRSK